MSLSDFDRGKLRQQLAEDGLEVLMLKDWDLPLYVAYGIADCGVVGSDVLEELRPDLLVPLRLRDGHCRMSLIAKQGKTPEDGSQVRVATKYPRWSRRLLEGRAWGTEILTLQGSVELGPLLDLADVAVDIVQTGSTIRQNNLVEIEKLADIAPCLIVGRSAFQHHRAEINRLIHGLELAGVVV